MFQNFPRISATEVLRKRVPIIRWLPRYRIGHCISDFVAGLTVGLTLLPQAIAYAALAGLGPQYGLYSSFAGSLVYIIFGTVKEVNIGPTALLSLLTFTYTKDMNSDFAVLLCFLSGVIELLCGILHLGFVVEFVSVPVTAGFCSATAVIIASSQVKGLLGIKVNSESFVETWSEIFKNIPDTRPWDLTLSIGCCSILLGMRKLKDMKFNGKKPSVARKILGRALWLLATARNALVVVACAGLAYFLSQHAESPFLLTGTIQSGLPPVGLPPFSTTIGNQTYTFLDMCSHLGVGMVVVPLVSLLGNVAIAKAFANGEIMDATQEMITLGLCNIVGSFFRSMPVSGSFSRSAVNNASGVKTPLGGLYTGALIILALSFLTPYFFFIPKATLSSVIICAVIFMVEVRLVRLMWKTSKRDLIPAFASFILCLWKGVEIGILLGVAVDLLYLLYINARPRCNVENSPNTQECITIQPSGGLLFPAIDFLRTKISKVSTESSGPIVVDCLHINALDFTGLQGLKALVEDMKKMERPLLFYRVKDELAQVLKSSIGPDFVNASTDLALTQLIKGLQELRNNMYAAEDVLEPKADPSDAKDCPTAPQAPEPEEGNRREDVQ
ncbi:UNVERIFIED_CONTAM: hypothetical protein PYX00_000335 [Menopon gallinae]|uniref:STAS domain-containing protein n=1 Tax=Menopon gallinae TaxID=328185 RepID=A0AAW2I9P4_9NEOP